MLKVDFMFFSLIDIRVIQRVAILDISSSRILPVTVITIPIPFVYLLFIFVNIKARFIGNPTHRRIVVRYFFAEVKKEFFRGPLPLLLKLFFVGVAMRYELKRDFATSQVDNGKTLPSAHVAEQPQTFGYAPVEDVVNQDCPYRVEFIFRFDTGVCQFDVDSLVSSGVLRKLEPISSYAAGIFFETVSNVEILNSRHCVINRDKLLLSTPFELENIQYFPFQGASLFNDSALAMNSSVDLVDLIDSNKVPLFFGYSHNPNNYYHFMIEVLPRLIIFKEESDVATSALIHSSTPKQIRDLCLRTLGAEPIELRRMSSDLGLNDVKVIRDFRHPKLVDHLDSDDLGNCFSSRYEELHRSKSFLESHFPHVKAPRESNANCDVFLTRPLGSLRTPDNLGLIENLMRDSGVKVFDPTHEDLAIQVGTFRNASRIFALSGASLTNLMFCKPGTEIFLIPPDFTHMSFTFWRDYAQIFDLHFTVLKPAVTLNSTLQSFSVDPSQLGKFLI